MIRLTDPYNKEMRVLGKIIPQGSLLPIKVCQIFMLHSSKSKMFATFNHV